MEQELIKHAGSIAASLRMISIFAGLVAGATLGKMLGEIWEAHKRIRLLNLEIKKLEKEINGLNRTV